MTNSSESTTILIKNAQINSGGNALQPQELLIQAGKITAMATEIPIPANFSGQIFDAGHHLVSPGLVDLHVHLRDPGQTYKETITTGSQAAARGGFTYIGAMPNLTPAPDTPAQLAVMNQRNQTEAVVHIGQYATLTTDRRGDQLVDFAGLAATGVLAFSNDGSGIQTADTMYRAMLAAKAVDKPVAAHVEDDSLRHGGVLNAGAKAQELGLPGLLEVVQTAQLARDLVLAQATGVHYHVCHVATAAELTLIRQAKAAGVQVTCEVSPHHLLLADQDIPGDDANYKMNPPLRTESDRQAMVAGLLDGTIDCIATDHAPHSQAEKDQGFRQAPFGIVGSETAFALLYTKFVQTGVFTLAQLLNWLSQRPAALFQLNQVGRLAVGGPADLALFDLDQVTPITAQTFASKGQNSPFIGWPVAGHTVATMVAGQFVYQRQEVQR